MIRLFFFLSGCAIFVAGPLSYKPLPMTHNHRHTETATLLSPPMVKADGLAFTQH